MMPVPAAFDGFIEHSKRVSSTCLITFEHNRYSVPASFANRVISLRVYPERLVIVAEARVVAEHVRVFSRDKGLMARRSTTGGTISPSPSVNPAPCAMGLPSSSCRRASGNCAFGCSSAPAVTARWWRSSRWCCCTTSSSWSGCGQALEMGEPSKQHVLNCLSRLQEPERPQRLQAPAKLKLVTEPVADTPATTHSGGLAMNPEAMARPSRP
jgi:hypothetical protein